MRRMRIREPAASERLPPRPDLVPPGRRAQQRREPCRPAIPIRTTLRGLVPRCWLAPHRRLCPQSRARRRRLRIPRRSPRRRPRGRPDVRPERLSQTHLRAFTPDGHQPPFPPLAARGALPPLEQARPAIRGPPPVGCARRHATRPSVPSAPDAAPWDPGLPATQGASRARPRGTRRRVEARAGRCRAQPGPATRARCAA